MDKNILKNIPVFFALDDNYAPYFAVAVKSLLLNASKDYFYSVHVLNDGLKEETKKRLSAYKTENSEVIFDDVSCYVEKIKPRLNEALRDYYTASIFYRLFIAALYPDYDKAIYLDSDVTVIGDVSVLYQTDLGDNVLGAVPDDVIAGNDVFRNYARFAVGVEYEKYFNSGVLVMNLDAYRRERIKEKFIFYLLKYNFESAAPDQDYLNVLCKDKVTYLERGWDRMSTDEDYDGEIYLVHYNNFRKPWYYDGVPYEKYFWRYAEQTDYYDEIKRVKENFTTKDEENHFEGLSGLVAQADKIAKQEVNFRTVFEKQKLQKSAL